MDKIRQKFEELITIKGLSFKWDGKRYQPTNVQNKWLYFSYGWIMCQEKK